MKLYKGKWFIALRVRDFCFGVGSPNSEIVREVMRDRPHRGI